jgi:hypothetical protein
MQGLCTKKTSAWAQLIGGVVQALALKVNEDKAQGIYLSHRIRLPESLLTLNRWNIPLINNVKYLVIFSRKITWRLHIKTIEGKVEVEVTLRTTVSRPVRLGVLPFLEQVIRCYIYLRDNYCLYFSCRAPSQTRGRVCYLQCNDASSFSSYTATDDLSASSSWCQILISLCGIIPHCNNLQVLVSRQRLVTFMSMVT